jgi:hypothetical protein
MLMLRSHLSKAPFMNLPHVVTTTLTTKFDASPGS